MSREWNERSACSACSERALGRSRKGPECSIRGTQNACSRGGAPERAVVSVESVVYAEQDRLQNAPASGSRTRPRPVQTELFAPRGPTRAQTPNPSPSYTPSYSAKPLLLVFSMSSAGSVFLHVIIEDSSGKLKGVRDENNAVGCVSLPVVSRRNGGVHKRITPSSRKLSNTSGAIRVELCNRVFNSGVNPNWFKKDDGSIDVWRDDLMKLDDGRVRKEMRLRGMDEMDKASDEERLRSLVESMRRDEEVQSLMHGCEYPAECRMVAQPYNVCAVKESLQGTGAGRVAEEGGLKGGRGEEFDWEVEGAEKEGEGGREERVSINADLLRLHKEAWQKAAKEIVEEGEEGEEGDDM